MVGRGRTHASRHRHTQWQNWGGFGILCTFFFFFFYKRKFERILKTHLGHPRTEKSGGQSTRRSRRQALRVQGEGVWSRKGSGQHRGPVGGQGSAGFQSPESQTDGSAFWVYRVRGQVLPAVRRCRLRSTFSFPCEACMRMNPETRFLLTQWGQPCVRGSRCQRLWAVLRRPGQEGSCWMQQQGKDGPP